MKSTIPSNCIKYQSILSRSTTLYTRKEARLFLSDSNYEPPRLLPPSRSPQQNNTRRNYTTASPPFELRRRVVCTGIGIVSPLGCSVEVAWQNLINGRTGVRLNERDGFEGIPSRVAAFVPRGTSDGELDVDRYASQTERKYLSDNMIYALAAADEALSMAHWFPVSEEHRQRTGVAIGAGMVDLEAIHATTQTLIEKGYRRISPYFVPRILVNMAAGHVSIKYGFQGPNHAASTACTTGTHAIGDAARMIRNGDADVMVCGSTDAPLVPVSLAGFSRARALSTSFTNSEPERSSRPFDRARDGFVAGEGCAILVLEELEHARARSVEVIGEVIGYGMSGDAHHMTAPREDGLGALLCMRAAMRDARIDASEVQYVNAHATSTPLGDAIENRAIKRCFGDHAYNMQISSFKGALGHLLGAAGSVETALTMLALKRGVVPPTIHIDELDEQFDLNYVANEAQSLQVDGGMRRIAVKNSFGFGGTNAALCLAGPPDE